MTKHSVLLVALAFLAVGLNSERASAQIDTDGAVQIGISGFGLVGADDQVAFAGLSLTKFTGERLEIGGDLMLSFTKSSGSDSEVGGFFMGRTRYNFIGESMTVPFVSAGVGTQLDDPGEGESRPVIFQVGVGFKHFLNENVSFNVEALSYAALVDGEFEVMEAAFILFGLSIYVGR